MHAHAFLTGPWDPQNRPHQLYLLMTIVLRYSCLYGEVYATPRMEAVATWLESLPDAREQPIPGLLCVLPVTRQLLLKRFVFQIGSQANNQDAHQHG